MMVEEIITSQRPWELKCCFSGTLMRKGGSSRHARDRDRVLLSWFKLKPDISSLCTYLQVVHDQIYLLLLCIWYLMASK